MVRNVLFIMTHHGSGWERLTECLEQNLRIQCFKTGLSYSHPDDVALLRSNDHRCRNSSAIWADVILDNSHFNMRRLAEHYKFLFWSCDYSQAAEELKTKFGDRAEDYYAYRLDGMRQYWSRRQTSLWNPALDHEAILGAIFG